VAHTDDLIKGILPPREGEDWKDSVITLNKVNGRYDELANPIGIFRNLDKSEILLPTEVDLESIEALAHFPNRTHEGLVVVGVPIGTDAFVTAFSLSKAADALHRGNSLLPLAEEQPKMALNLLGCCINTAMDYCGRTIPPQLLLQAALVFDKGIDDLRIQIMSPPGATFAPASEKRFALGTQIAQLPLRHGGMGHTSARVKCPPAYYAATLQCMRERRIWEDRHILYPKLELAYKSVCDLL
jgi:hypothetical protein